MLSKKLLYGMQCLHFEFSATEGKRNKKLTEDIMTKLNAAKSKDEVAEAMKRVEEEAKETKRNLEIAQELLQSQGEKNAEDAEGDSKAKEEVTEEATTVEADPTEMRAEEETVETIEVIVGTDLTEAIVRAEVLTNPTEVLVLVDDETNSK